SDVIRKVQRRLAQLELLQRAIGNVGRRGANRFVADIHAVHVDARSTAEAPSEGNRGIANFGGIKVLTVLNLDARLQLRQVQEVAPIDWEVFDLLRRQHA